MFQTLRTFWKAHWIKIVCLLLGVVLVVVGGYYLANNQHFTARAAQANGVIVGIERSVHRDRDGFTSTTYCPVVRFVTMREQTVEFTSAVCSGHAQRVGASVKVMYDPNNPHHAKLDTLWGKLARWSFGIAVVLVGLVFVIGSIAARPDEA